MFDYDYSVTINSPKEYDKFIDGLEGYNDCKCDFYSPSFYPAILYYNKESCPNSRDMIYSDEYSYPEEELKQKVDFLISFVYHLDTEDILIQKETTKLTDEYQRFDIVNCSTLRKIAEEWLRNNE